MIKYKCPKCGKQVEHLIHPTSPLQDHYRCTNSKCDYHRDILRKTKDVEIIAPE